ncbi:plant self-incompatibility S1 [Artemisia annua]|uniref:S-protein homolog n=1 Tax=Artemisia annua TaxID=35608 RepID=A0A2U1LN66_ARTAN|nr:plant self-incompatibility S1 [Artemisia annua]
MKIATIIFVFLYLVFNTNASPVAKTPTANTKKVCLWDHWVIYIFNHIKDPIHVRVKSEDDDLGDHTLALNQNENFSFCENFLLTTMFYADFKWKGKTALFVLFDKNVWPHCGKGSLKKSRVCLWIVRDDGFYVAGEWAPFPDGWTKMYDWS